MALWRLVESPAADIFSQMELDRQLFEELTREEGSLPLLRIYQVSPPALTLGCSYKKRFSRFLLNLQSFLQYGRRLPICVRPTGGGTVRHGDDLLYSVIASRRTFLTFDKVRTSYLSFHEAIQEAFENLGIETQLFRCDDPRVKRRARSRFGEFPDACFQTPVATDVALGDQKIAGGAQRRKGNTFLHQGSIRIPEGVSFEKLSQAFIAAFERKFAVTWSHVKIAEVHPAPTGPGTPQSSRRLGARAEVT